MGRTLIVMLTIVLTVGFLTPLVYGANAQGLYWGLKEGDRLEYMVSQHASIPPYSATSIEERIYVVVNNLPSIPERVTEMGDLLLSNVTFYWENGSTIIGTGVFLMIGNPFFVLPAGNWSLIGDLWFPQPTPGYTLIDDSSLWGLKADYGGEYGGYVMNQSLTYLKSDGAVYEYMIIARDKETNQELIHIEVSRIITEIGPLGLLAIATIPIEIIVAVLVIKKHRQ